MYTAIARNKRNTVLILLTFLLIIGGLGWLAGASYDSPVIIVVTIVVAGVYATIQCFAADGLAVSMSGATRITKADDPRLYRNVENLAITTGVPMPRVYAIRDDAPNAFATGRDPQHATIAATTGLLEMLDDAELEGVMAHELGHVRNYDIRVSMMVFGLIVAVGFLADMLVRLAFFGRGRGGNPLVLVFGLVAMLVAPLVVAAEQAAVSRQREYLADATGAMTTRHPDALASALQKIAASGRPVKRQNSSMAHLSLADPMKPGVMDRLFSTHPPIPDRVRRLERMGGRF